MGEYAGKHWGWGGWKSFLLQLMMDSDMTNQSYNNMNSANENSCCACFEFSEGERAWYISDKKKILLVYSN